MAKEKWISLTDDQKKAYWTTKDKLKAGGKIKPGKPKFPDSTGKSSDILDDAEGNGNDEKKGLSKSKEKRLKASIKKLEKAAEELEKTTDATNTTPTDPGIKYDFGDMTEAHKTMINKMITQHGGRKINGVRTITYSNINNLHTTSDDNVFHVTVDGGADTCLDGKGHIFLEYTERVANVVGFDDDMAKTNLHIGTSITLATLPSGENVLILKNESIDHTGQSNSMLSVNQVRDFGVDIDDCPSQYQVDGRYGRQSMILGIGDDGDQVVLPFNFTNNLVSFDIREPTLNELDTLPMYCITSDQPWNPHADDNIAHDINSVNVSRGEGRCIVNHPAHQRVMARLNKYSSTYASLRCCFGLSMSPSKYLEIYKLAQSTNTISTPSPDPSLAPTPSPSNNVNDLNLCDSDDDDIECVRVLCREVKTKGISVDPQHLFRNMMIKDKTVVQKTLEATTQLGKHIVRLP